MTTFAPITKPNAATAKHVAGMNGCVRAPGRIERQDPTTAGSFMG